MSDWIIAGKAAPLVGEAAQEILKVFIAAQQKLGGIIGNAEAVIAALDALPAPLDTLGDKISGAYRSRAPEELVDLFSKAERLAASGNPEDRRIGWPLSEILGAGKQLKSRAGITLSLDAAASLGGEFRIDAASDDDDGDMIKGPSARLSINGALSAGLSLSALSKATANLSASAGEGVEWSFNINPEARALQLLAEALIIAGAAPDDFQALLEAFDREGALGLEQISLDRHWGIAAGADIRIPVKAHAAIGGEISLSGRIERGKTTRITLRRATGGEAPCSGILLMLEADERRAGGAGFGLRVTVGLSSIAGGAAKTLGREMADLKPVLDAIEGHLGKAESWLTPSTLLTEILPGEVSKLLGGEGDGLIDTVSAILGAPADSSEKLLTDLVAGAVDDAMGLFGDNGEAVLRRALNDRLDHLAPALANTLDGLVKSLISKLDGKIGESAAKLDAAAQKKLAALLGLPSSGGNVAAQLRTFLDAARARLGQVLRLLSELETAELAIAFSFMKERLQESSADARLLFCDGAEKEFRSMMRRPTAWLSGVLDQKTPPAHVHVLEGMIATRARTSRKSVFSLTVLGRGLSSAKTRVADFKSTRTLTGVEYGTTAEVKAKVKAFHAERLCEVFSAQTFLQERHGGPATSDFSSDGMRFRAAMVEKKISPEEGRKFLEPFVEAQICSAGQRDACVEALADLRRRKGKGATGELSVLLGLDDASSTAICIEASRNPAAAERIAAQALLDSSKAFRSGLRDMLEPRPDIVTADHVVAYPLRSMKREERNRPGAAGLPLRRLNNQVEATRTFGLALAALGEILTATQVSDESIKAASERFSRRIDDWARPRTPLLTEDAGPYVVGLFNAIGDMVERVRETRPVAILTLDVEGEDAPRLFV